MPGGEAEAAAEAEGHVPTACGATAKCRRPRAPGRPSGIGAATGTTRCRAAGRRWMSRPRLQHRGACGRRARARFTALAASGPSPMLSIARNVACIHRRLYQLHTQLDWEDNSPGETDASFGHHYRHVERLRVS